MSLLKSLTSINSGGLHFVKKRPLTEPKSLLDNPEDLVELGLTVPMISAILRKAA